MIDVQQITKRYGEHTAIDRVTFSVAKGEILAFLGPNGAGKTTTMRILTCFMPATQGTAKIAGFDCRKAVGKVMDSIIVIAFYTDEIVPSGGPESFAGLPGMILGVAIPRMHTTWYATKLQLAELTPTDLAVPKKGKKLAGADFQSQLDVILKRWGDRGSRIRWQMLL